nr:hypothetical protein CFP56_12249 [Quercus suber]
MSRKDIHEQNSTVANEVSISPPLWRTEGLAAGFGYLQKAITVHSHSFIRRRDRPGSVRPRSRNAAAPSYKLLKLGLQEELPTHFCLFLKIKGIIGCELHGTGARS